MGNRKHFEVLGFLNVSGQTDIHTFPKPCEKPQYRGSMGKPKQFEVLGFLHVLGGADIDTTPEISEK